MKRFFLPILLSLFLLVGSLAAVTMPADSRHVEVVVTTEDTTSGEASSTAPLWGYVKAVHLDYAAGISSTTDITLTTASDPAATIMTVSDTITDGWYYPSVQFTGADGSAVSGAYGRFPIDDYLSVQAGETPSDTTILTATIYYGQ